MEILISDFEYHIVMKFYHWYAKWSYDYENIVVWDFWLHL